MQRHRTVARRGFRVALILLAGCATEPPSGGDTETTTVGAAGGTVSYGDGGATLVIPPSALNGDVDITVAPRAPEAGDPPMLPGSSYDFGPDGTVFAKPAALTLAYDPAEVPAGVAEESLYVFTIRHDGLQEFYASSVNTAARTVTADIHGFSPKSVGPCTRCDELILAAEYNPERTVSLSWHWPFTEPPPGPVGSKIRIERAKVSGGLTVEESDFQLWRDINPTLTSYLDNDIGTDAAIYFYRVRWLGSVFLAPPSNVEQVTVFGIEGAPTARFTWTPSDPEPHELVTFDATASSDDGSIASYAWDFTDDGVYDSPGSTAQFIYTTAGTFIARLRVVDNDGIGSEVTHPITVTGPVGADVTLTLVVENYGEVFSRDGNESTALPPSIQCFGDSDPNTPPVECAQVYESGTELVLTPISFNPDIPPGELHADWQGCDRVTTPYGDCVVTMNASRTVTATLR